MVIFICQSLLNPKSCDKCDHSRLVSGSALHRSSHLHCHYLRLCNLQHDPRGRVARSQFMMRINLPLSNLLKRPSLQFKLSNKLTCFLKRRNAQGGTKSEDTFDNFQAKHPRPQCCQTTILGGKAA